MSVQNSEYDFKWCPGCGDFGVRRALDVAMQEWMKLTETPVENNIIVAGIGCSGNMVHLLDGPQPYGFHGIHGRSLPVSMGIKMARPELNVIVVAGDGDFLSIGMEHIGPQASRNLDVTAIVMDNGVYGLTKGQSSPTTNLGEITSSTPYGKLEIALDPLELYLTLGVSFIASGFSSKPKDLAKLISEGMNHNGFSVIHVQSPCTTYNDNYDELKGNKEKGIPATLWEIPEDHDSSDLPKAYELIRSGGIPLGIIYRDVTRPSLTQHSEKVHADLKTRTVEQLLSSYDL